MSTPNGLTGREEKTNVITKDGTGANRLEAAEICEKGSSVCLLWSLII